MPQPSEHIWGDLFAEVPDAEGKVEGARQWVPVGIVERPGESSRASLVFTMHTEPICWRECTWTRRLMIVKRKAVQT